MHGILQINTEVGDDPVAQCEGDLHVFMWCPVMQQVPMSFFFVQKLLISEAEAERLAGFENRREVIEYLRDNVMGDHSIGICVHENDKLVLVQREGWILRQWFPTWTELSDMSEGIYQALKMYNEHKTEERR